MMENTIIIYPGWIVDGISPRRDQCRRVVHHDVDVSVHVTSGTAVFWLLEEKEELRYFLAIELAIISLSVRKV